jgi:AraC-like DNA-binding protein
MTIDIEAENLLLPFEQIDGRNVHFNTSPLARENYLYLINAGSFTAEGECLLGEDMPGYTLIYTLSGIGRVDIGERGCAIGAREGVLINKKPSCHLSVDHRSGQPWRFFIFCMDGACFPAYYDQLITSHAAFRADERLFGSVPRHSGPAFVRFKAEEGSFLDSEIQKLAHVAMLQNSAQAELVASTAIISLLTELIVGGDPAEGAARPMPRYIEGIMKYINEFYRQQITLDELAAEFNVSKFHLSREFKKYTGYSPNEYVISVRINRAKELLRHTSRTIAEISQITGCGDVNHFIQLFKSRENVTPAVFRRRWNKDSRA